MKKHNSGPPKAPLVGKDTAQKTRPFWVCIITDPESAALLRGQQLGRSDGRRY